jgi:hypothetical protein
MIFIDTINTINWLFGQNMTQQIINIGSSTNAGDGDPIRTAFLKVNQNFTEIYSNISSIELGEVSWETITNKPTLVTDISQLTDNQGLLADSFDGGGAASEYDEEQTIDGGQA